MQNGKGEASTWRASGWMAWPFLFQNGDDEGIIHSFKSSMMSPTGAASTSSTAMFSCSWTPLRRSRRCSLVAACSSDSCPPPVLPDHDIGLETLRRRCFPCTPSEFVSALLGVISELFFPPLGDSW